MRIRTTLFALSLLLPTLAQAGGTVRWTLNNPTGFSFTTGSTRTARAPGLRPANRYRGPQAPSGTLIPVTQIGRVGGPTINFNQPVAYVSPGGSRFFRQQLGDTIRQSVQQQCKVVQGGQRRRSRSRLRGVRTHGVGASSAGYTFPLNR